MTGAVTDRSPTSRALPMLDDPARRRSDAAPAIRRPADARLAEYLPETRALPRFHVWTLGCQMNRSDSEEMAGRLLAAGCDEAPSLRDADLIVINTCAIREGAEQKVIGRQGQLAKLKAANPGLRVVLTGCSVREPDRAGLRRRYPGGGPVPAARRGARARRPARPGVGPGADRGRRPDGDDHGRRTDGRGRRRPPGRDARRGRGGGDRRARVGDQRLAADHLRLRQDLHLLHRAVQPRPGAQPPVRRDRRRGAGARGGRLPARSRCSARTSTPTATTCAPEPRFGHVDDGPLGRPPARPARPARPRRADPGDRRAPDRRRPAGHRAAALRDLAPVGPLGSAHRGAGRLRVASASTSTCRSSRATTRCCAGWAASTRSSTTWSAWPGSARPSRASRSRPTSSSGSAARPRPSSRRRSRCSRPSATTRSSRRPTRRGPGRPRRGSPTTCRAADKRRRLNELLALQEGIGLERNRGVARPRGRGARRTR